MKKLLYGLLLFCVLCVSLIFSCIINASTGWLFLIGSIAMVMLFNFDKLKSFKFYGLAAELRDTINEANATIEQLKSLAIVVAEPAISLIAANITPAPMPFLYRKSLVDRINFVLREVGIVEGEIKRMNDVFRFTLRLSHGMRIVEGIQVPKDLHLTSNRTFASPEDYEEFLISRSMLTDDRKELIEDLKYFIEKDKLRRPETWEDK